MTRMRRRLIVLLACGVCLGSATALTLTAFNDNLVFFVSPADVLAHSPPSGRLVRLGGLVEAGSVEHVREDGKPAVRFRVTDGKVGVPVDYVGVLPDLFREGQGVVAEGSLGADGVFTARVVFAKHDENYMPPEVAKALKEAGQWREGTAKK
jgi:cytochrome c-type biogenesis protein CcmE